MRFEVTVRGLKEAEAYIQQIDRRLQNDRHAGLYKAINRIADMWLDSFDAEGSRVTGWQPLSEYTVMRREEDGYGGTNPILKRSGALKSVMVEGFTRIKRPGITSRNDTYSSQTTRAGLALSGDGAVVITASGWKVSNQYDTSSQRFGHPARPIWFVDKNVLTAARGGLVDWLANEVLEP